MDEIQLRKMDLSASNDIDNGGEGLLLALVSGLLCWLLVAAMIVIVIH
jgi:hypothetical protein